MRPIIDKRLCRHGGIRRSRIPPPAGCVRHPARGFTLLEILIAISIFAVVVTTIFGSFNFVFGNVDAIEKGMTDYEMAGDGLNRMVADLQSIYISLPPAYETPENTDEPDPYRLVGEIDSVGGGEFSRLRFTSLSHLPVGRDQRQGIAEITYYIQQQPDSTLTLKRSDRLDFSEPPEYKRNDPILCENVRALKFTYLDAEGDERDRWDSDAALFEYATPRAIRIRLAAGSGEQTHAFEVLVSLPVHRENPEEVQYQTIPSQPGAIRTYRAVPQ